MTQEISVSAFQFCGQRSTSWLGLATSGQLELYIRPSSRLLNHQFNPLAGLKRTCIQDGERATVAGRRRVSEKKLSIDPVENNSRADSKLLPHRLRYKG